MGNSEQVVFQKTSLLLLFLSVAPIIGSAIRYWPIFNNIGCTHAHYTPHANCALLAVLSGFMADAKSRKKSPIWEHFVVGEDTKFTLCRICKQSVSFNGCNTKTYNTTNPVCRVREGTGERRGGQRQGKGSSAADIVT